MTRIVLAFVLTAFCASAQAQYPEKPVRFVVPFAPGGATDLLARTIGEKLAAATGRPFVVENKPGAATQIAAQYVATAPADGYTILMATSTTLAINKSLYSKLPYDPEKDFAPISLVVQHPFVLVVDPKLPAKTVKDLIALAEAQPGKLSYASGGSGSFAHLSMALFQTMTGVDAIHVPYKGSAPALLDIMGGQVAMMFDNTAHNHISSGKLRALGVTTRERLSVLPEVPTLHEAGVPGYDLAAWQGVVAAAGTPRLIVDKLNAAIRKLLQLPDVRQRLTADGGQIITSTPEEFSAHISREIVRFAKIVKDSGAKVD
jgi:tripartite-type tricarboxylate transporter receptor subunit TctC